MQLRQQGKGTLVRSSTIILQCQFDVNRLWKVNPPFLEQLNRIQFYQQNYNRLMNQVSLDKLSRLSKQPNNQYFLKSLRKNISSRQNIIAKSVYNLQSRNITKFTKEWIDCRRKMQLEEHIPKAHRQLILRKRYGNTLKYEEDEALQLQYHLQFNNKKNIEAEVMDLQQKQTTEGRSSKNLRLKKTINRYSMRAQTEETRPIESRDKILINSKEMNPRKKSKTIIRQRKPTFLRNRVATQWQSLQQKEAASRLSLNRGVDNISPQLGVQTDIIMTINKEKMDRFVRNLHRLEWSYKFLKRGGQDGSKEYREHMKTFRYDVDNPIDEQAINQMLAKRYNMLTNHLEDIYEQRQSQLIFQTGSLATIKINNSDQYTFLHSLSKQSILQLMQKHHVDKRDIPDTNPIETSNKFSKNHLCLPYSEFISFRQTKASIYQLVGMSSKMCLRLAFMIFDKNRNGLIDQQDLLQLISLSRNLTIVEKDIGILVSSMVSESQTKKKPFFSRSKINPSSGRYQNESSLKPITIRQKTISQDSERMISPIIEQDFMQSENDPNSTSLVSSRFSVEKLYTFLKNKEESIKSNSRNSIRTVRSLNFSSFCQAFKYQRPYLIYDLLMYILGAVRSDFSPSVQTVVFGIPQRGSVQKMATQNEQTLEERWNKRLKNTNQMVKQLVKQHQQI